METKKNGISAHTREDGSTVTVTKKTGPVTVKHLGPGAWSRLEENEA